MKKLLTFIGVSFLASVCHALTGPFVQITTGTLQPNTTNGFFVSSGTAISLNTSNIKSTGSWTLNGATETLTAVVRTGTVIEKTTGTWTGTQTISSATIASFTAQSATMTFVKIGTATQNIGMNNASKIVGLAAGTTAGDSLRFEQMRIVSISSGSRSSAFTTTATTFQGAASSCTITPASASNWVAVIIQGVLTGSASGQLTLASIGRNGANLGGTNGLTNASISSPNFNVPVSMLFVDLPGTTSATLYEPMVRTSVGSTDYCAANTTCTTLCVEIAP